MVSRILARISNVIADAKVSGSGKITGSKIPQIEASNMVVNILNTAYFIAGIVAVGMIIFAGIQYLTANGEPDKAKKAMNTIIFSVVGLIIVLAAFAITNFVITNVGG